MNSVKIVRRVNLVLKQISSYGLRYLRRCLSYQGSNYLAVSFVCFQQPREWILTVDRMK